MDMAMDHVMSKAIAEAKAAEPAKIEEPVVATPVVAPEVIVAPVEATVKEVDTTFTVTPEETKEVLVDKDPIDILDLKEPETIEYKKYKESLDKLEKLDKLLLNMQDEVANTTTKEKLSSQEAQQFREAYVKMQKQNLELQERLS